MGIREIEMRTLDHTQLLNGDVDPQRAVFQVAKRDRLMWGQANVI